MKYFSYPSYAKINLIFKIHNLRKDGYHNISSLIQRINLKDTIYIGFVSSREKLFNFFSKKDLRYIFLKKYNLIFSCNKNSLLSEDNIILKVYKKIHLIQKKIPNKSSVILHIHLKKKIPIGAGLGGSSTNGAKILEILNNLWNIHYKKKSLLKIGSTIGSDIPFFLANSSLVEVEKKGQVKKIYSEKLKYFILIIYPNFEISSLFAYNLYKENSIKNTNNYSLNNIHPLISRIKEKKHIQTHLENSFKPYLFNLFPKLNKLEQYLCLFNPLGINLTGSGSSIYAIFSNIQETKKVKKHLSKKWPNYTYIISYPY